MATDVNDLRTSRTGDRNRPPTTPEEADQIRKEREELEARLRKATEAVRQAEELRSDLYHQLIELRRRCGHPRSYYAGNGIDHCPDCGLDD